jgi:NAD(P)-dependent dehydrogenase (short-subunit alcohol dehydrogenase family)
MRAIDEQVILVTGATDGLGRGVAADLLERGATVLLHGRSEERGERTLRELREETGLHGGQWATGPAVWATPGFCTERIHLFAVTGAEEGETDRDAGEQIEIVRLPFEDVLASATSGGIDDAKTLAGVLWLAAMRAA